MARVNHTVQSMPVWKDGTFATNGDESIITWVAATPADDEEFSLIGDEVILFWNTSTDTQYTFTITSVKDAYGRLGDLGPVQVEFGEIHRVQLDSPEVFRQSNGKVYFECSNAAMKIAILRPRRA